MCFVIFLQNVESNEKKVEIKSAYQMSHLLEMSHIGIYYGFFDKTANITHLMSHSLDKNSKNQRNHKILKIILSSPYPGFPSENICISVRSTPDVDGLGRPRLFTNRRPRTSSSLRWFSIFFSLSLLFVSLHQEEGIVNRVSPLHPIFVCWCRFISHENKFNKMYKM